MSVRAFLSKTKRTTASGNQLPDKRTRLDVRNNLLISVSATTTHFSELIVGQQSLAAMRKILDQCTCCRVLFRRGQLPYLSNGFV